MPAIRTVCPHDCPDQCSLIATVEDGRLIRVQGDPDHAFTRGFLCGKVNRYPERVYSPERVLTPLRRSGPKGAGEFTPISWEEALDEIVTRWQSIFATYGTEALLGYAYSGHMGVINRNLPQALFNALGASRMITGTVCDSACDAGWEYAVGNTPGPDPETVCESDLIIAWGANLVTTNVHLIPFIDAARERGAQFIVIDPFRTRTAKRADWHIAPRIGTDTALALGIMHVLVRDGLLNRAYIASHTVGFERLRDETLPRYTPERVEAITNVPAADIARLARMYGSARAPYIRLGMGFSRNSGGGMAVRTVACLPALVGAWEKPGGGASLATASIWGFDYAAVRRPELLPRETRRINHSLLGRALLEEITPPIMALFVASNNPALTCPDQERVRRGLLREDLFTVVHDLLLSDTARYADIVLPACTPVETEDLYRSYGTFYLQHGPRLIEPLGASRSNHWLMGELARRLGIENAVFGRTPREHIAALFAGASGPVTRITPERVLAGGPIKLELEPERTVPAVTAFFSEAMERDGLPPLPEWTPDPLMPHEPERWPLRLLTLPGHFQHHSAFAGVASLQRRQGPPACVLHPDDAAARGIMDGDPVLLFNERGEVGMYARISDDTPPGVVAVEGNRNQGHFLCGGPLNVLVSDHLTDMGAGATYQSTWLDVRRLEKTRSQRTKGGNEQP